LVESLKSDFDISTQTASRYPDDADFQGLVTACFDKHQEYKLRMFHDWMNSLASSASWFITGPAGHNATKEQQKIEIEQKKLCAWLECSFDYYVKGKIQKYIDQKYPAYSVGDTIKSDNPHAVQLLTEKLAKLEKEQEFMKQYNVAFRKKDEELLSQYPERKGVFKSFELTSVSSNIRKTRERLEVLKVCQEKEDETFTLPQGELIVSYKIQTMYLNFNDVPSAAIRAEIKKQGWRYNYTTKQWSHRVCRYTFKTTKEWMIENGNS
jgi:hypothetical protein